MRQISYFKSPVGIYKIIADDQGITSVNLQAANEYALKEEERESNSNKLDQSQTSSQHIKDCLTWLKAYFFDSSSLEKVKFPELSTREHANRPFCRKVWEILRDRVKFGETVTYGELAKMAGNPKGARAVGMAMKTNPIPIIVPCHRVIKSGGDLGNYSSYNGVTTKKWLLQHENAFEEHLSVE